ncbi:hypothetical protein PIB30_115048, partial [Stylosanthes scabra]|nr:hypothetical protein [Stylosanthes scabra]
VIEDMSIQINVPALAMEEVRAIILQSQFNFCFCGAMLLLSYDVIQFPWEDCTYGCLRCSYVGS